MSNEPFDPWKELRLRGYDALVLVVVGGVGLVIVLLFLWLTTLSTGHTPR